MNTEQKAVTDSLVASVKHVGYCGCTIEIVARDFGFGAKINGKILGQFDAPLDYYWFSTEHSAIQAAKQLINTNSLL
jgi:hypothetical protein